MIEVRFHSVFLAINAGYVRLTAEALHCAEWPYEAGDFLTTVRDLLRAGF